MARIRTRLATIVSHHVQRPGNASCEISVTAIDNTEVTSRRGHSRTAVTRATASTGHT
jgi:hypothetical protein